MVNEIFLRRELDRVGGENIILKPKKYSKDIFPKLFDKFNDFCMGKYSYCCYGLETSCWTEVVEEGNWDLTLEQVKSNILENVKHAKKYLYNGRKYGGNRLHMYEDNDCAYVYIYLRDEIGEDYCIWFQSIDKTND